MDAPKLSAQQRAEYQAELDRRQAASAERLAARPPVEEFYDVLKPLGSRVLLLWITDERTKGGLHVPDQAQERTRAEVFSYGPEANNYPTDHPMAGQPKPLEDHICPGFVVLVAAYAGRKLSVDVPREVEGVRHYDKREGQIVPVEFIEAVIERRRK